MDIIADSSVWFEYFKRKDPYYKEVQTYLNILSIKIIDPIIGEILQGALNQNEINFIREHIQFVPKINIKNLFEKAGEYSFENKLVSKGIGLIDACLIYTTIETNSLLWTLDKRIINFLDKKYLYD
ncbi:MAG: pilus assembly protein [Bacteroidia bacterium]|nr:pilus assembly protein [Bacteroidia bacterium]